MRLGPTQGDEKRLGPATTLYRTVPLPFVIPSAGEGSAVPRTLPRNVFSTELLWACGPPKTMRNASVQQLLSIEPLPFPLSSRAKPRDLRFRGPFLEMFFDRAYPDFLPRSTGRDHVCASGKPHEIGQRHQSQQEIRGSVVERICGFFRFSRRLLKPRQPQPCRHGLHSSQTKHLM
jgi:hypothetical protein